jgi:heme a synthase
MAPMLTPPEARRYAALSGAGSPLAIARWLYGVAAMVLVMVIVGGITRLTESGLSITEWRPITGALPPLNEAQWLREFDLYRSTTEYQTVNRGMSMADFQFIYFWEWFHRFLARMVGVAFALPLAWFAWKRMIPAGFAPRLVLLLALGGLQGVIGWWMVKSGLVGRTDVSHYRLAVHLNLAFLILGLLVWTARDMVRLARTPSMPVMQVRERLSSPFAVVLGILAIQTVWGAFVAGLNAGFAFDTWPLMGGEIFPSGVAMTAPWIANLVDNPIVVQFFHRWWAFVAAGALIWLGVKAMRSGDRAGGMALHLIVTVQIILGIATLWSGVALWIAVAHQGVGALLVAAAARAAHSAGPRGAALRARYAASAGETAPMLAPGTNAALSPTR